MSDDYKQGYREGFADGFSYAFALEQQRSRSRPTPEPIPPNPIGPPQTLIHKGIEPTIAELATAQNVIDPSWIPLRHYACGQISHYLTRRVGRRETAEVALLRKLDGTAPDPTEPSVCGACGEPALVWSAREMDYTIAFTPAATPIRTSAPDPVDEVVSALAKLEADVVASSKPAPAPQICLRCFEFDGPGHVCNDTSAHH